MMRRLQEKFLGLSIALSSFNLFITTVDAVPVKVGCIYQEGSIAKVVGYCTMNMRDNGRATLTWPDGINTALAFQLSGTTNSVVIDNKNSGTYSVGSDFYYIEYKTTEELQRRKIFIVGACLRCS